MTSLETSSRREFAPMLTRVWGSLAPVIAKLIVERPSLGQRLALAPARVIHGVAIYVDWAIKSDIPVDEIARNLDVEDVRNLLPSAIPDLHSRYFSLLGRLSGRVREQSFYLRLNAALHGPARDFLLQADAIDTVIVDLAEQYGRDPVLSAARHAIKGNHSRARALAGVLALLRALDVASEIEALPPGSGWPAIRRRIEADLGRVQGPPLSFGMPAGWQHINNVADLQRAGRRLDNCLVHFAGGGLDHYRRMIVGDVVLLMTEMPTPLIAEVERVGPNAWRIGCLLGRRNQHALDEIRTEFFTALSNAMTAADHFLLDGNPFVDLDRVATYGGHGGSDARWLEG